MQYSNIKNIYLMGFITSTFQPLSCAKETIASILLIAH